MGSCLLKRSIYFLAVLNFLALHCAPDSFLFFPSSTRLQLITCSKSFSFCTRNGFPKLRSSCQTECRLRHWQTLKASTAGNAFMCAEPVSVFLNLYGAHHKPRVYSSAPGLNLALQVACCSSFVTLFFLNSEKLCSCHWQYFHLLRPTVSIRYVQNCWATLVETHELNWSTTVPAAPGLRASSEVIVYQPLRLILFFLASFFLWLLLICNTLYLFLSNGFFLIFVLQCLGVEHFWVTKSW